MKEASETGHWLELLYRTNLINKGKFKALDDQCTLIRVMLITSRKTAKSNPNKSDS